MRASLLLLLLSPLLLPAQAPTIAWQRCLGSTFDENAYDAIQSSDTGYVITGYCSGNGGNVSGHHAPNGIPDAWICHLTPDGTQLNWSHAYGGSEDDNGMSVIQTADGGYLMAGYTSSNNGDVTFNHGGYDCWLVKTDAVGALEWQHTYGGSGEDRANSVVQADDGGYVVAGYTFSNDGDVTSQNGIADLWLFKVGASGNLQWRYSYGGSLYETGNQIIRYKEGYAVIGYTFSTDGDVDDRGGSPCDYWLLTTDTAGLLVDAVSYGGSGFDVGTSLTLADNDELVMTGYSDSNDGDITAHHYFYDVWTLRVDSSYTIIWEKSFGSDGYEEGFRVVRQPGGDFVLAGYADTDGDDVLGVNNAGYADYWIWRIDGSGDLIWQTPIGGSDDDQGYALVASVDGGWFVTGIGRSGDGDVLNNHGPGVGDFWCVKLEGGMTTGVNTPTLDAPWAQWNSDLNILQLAERVPEHARIAIFDARGQEVRAERSAGVVVPAHIAAGCYTWRITAGDRSQTGRFVAR